jgi:hypothetical protein
MVNKKEVNNSEVENVGKELNPQECPICGGVKKSNWETCMECKEREFRNLFDVKLKPLFGEYDEIITSLIKSQIDKPVGYIQKLTAFLIDNKLLNVRRDGNKNYYTLPGKTVAEEISKPVEEIKSKNRPIESPKTVANTPDHRTYADPENTPKTTTQILLITELLPSLINAALITIDPEDNILKADFPQQKSLLDLYETLPNHLKSLVKLHIDQESTVQKITIPLEG